MREERLRRRRRREHNILRKRKRLMKKDTQVCKPLPRGPPLSILIDVIWNHEGNLT